MAFPIATVATGTPRGIWTIERSESRPPMCWVGIGTPITGRSVLAASIPGRWAAPPAPATITLIPRPAASSAYWNSRSGVRCADTILNSAGTSSSSRMATAVSSVG